MKKWRLLQYLFIVNLSIININNCKNTSTKNSSIMHKILSTINTAKTKIFNLLYSDMFLILNNNTYQNITLESIVGFTPQKESLSLIIDAINKNDKKKYILSFIGPDGMQKEQFTYALANATQLPLIIIEALPPYSEVIKYIDNMFLFLQNNEPAIVYLEGSHLELLIEANFHDQNKIINYLKNKIKKTKNIIFIFDLPDFNRFYQLLNKSLGGKTIVFNQITADDTLALIKFHLNKYNLLLENINIINCLGNLFFNMTAEEIANNMEILHSILSNKKEKTITMDTIDTISKIIKKNAELEKDDEEKQTQIIRDKILDDIWGYKSIKTRLLDLIPHIKDKNKKQKGIIFSGPAGVGKTQMVKALAGSAKVNFITANPANLLSQNGPEIQWNINNLFQRAKTNTPCILFIDEIDILLNNKIANSSFLIELDGNEELIGVTVIGATNFVQEIDYRIKRSGRMSLEIKIPLPNKEDRSEIIENYLKKLNINNTSKNILNQLIERTINFSCADIKEYIYNIKEYLEENQLETITTKILFTKYIEMILGSKSELLIDKKEIIQIAYHETAHGLLQYILYRQGLAAHNFSFLTIEAHSDFLGVTVSANDDYFKSYTKTNIESDIKILLAGKCSQEIFLKSTDTGAISDLEKATNLAYGYITRFGMSKKRLAVKFIPYEAEQSKKIISQTETLLQNQYSLVKDFLISYKDLVEIIVKDVLEKKLLDRKGLDTIIERYESNHKKVII